MSDIVERVARAMFDAWRGRCGLDGPAWDSLGEIRDVYRADARAAIAALRQPDEAMWAAGVKAMDIASHDDPGLVWMRMLDAALNAPPAGKEGGYSAVGPEKPVR